MEYLLEGMRQRFHIGFRHDQECKKAMSNLKLAVGNPEVVDQYLSKEVGLGRVVGPIEPQDTLRVHISKFGEIPKSHQPGKWQLIVDLSHPKGYSVNDGIES